MDTTAGYRKHDPPRVCDICGHPWRKSDLRRIGPLTWACPDDANGMTAEQISRHNARAKPLIVKPVKHAKGVASIHTYQMREAELFNLLVNEPPIDLIQRTNFTSDFRNSWLDLEVAAHTTRGLAPFHVFNEAPPYVLNADGANADDDEEGDQTMSCAWAMMYLCELIDEDKRPTSWIVEGERKLRELADLALANQAGPTADLRFLQEFRTTDETKWYYGAVWLQLDVEQQAFDDPELTPYPVRPADTGWMCGAFAMAYRTLGDLKYLEGARRCATFLRRVQCLGQWVNRYPLNRGSGRLEDGAVPRKVELQFDENGLSELPTNVEVREYHVRDISIIWGLKILLDIDGDRVYGDTVPITGYVARTDALLSQMISRCIEWWFTPKPAKWLLGVDLGLHGGFNNRWSRPSMTALDFTSPFQYYRVGDNDSGTKTGENNYPVPFRGFHRHGGLHSYDYALAVRALWEVEGYTPRVAAIYEGLRAYKSNPQNQIPEGWSDQRIEESTLGTYDPDLCLAKFLLVADASGNSYEALGSPYDFRTAGLLAPIQAARDPANFLRMKQTVHKLQRRRRKARMAECKRWREDEIGNTEFFIDDIIGKDGHKWIPFDYGYDPLNPEGAEYRPHHWPEWPAFRPADDLVDLRFFLSPGLNFQVSFPDYQDWHSTNELFFCDLMQACMLAKIYRLEPKAFPELRG